MRVFVAGGSGAIGVPLVRALIEAGHQVTALTRSPDKQDALRALGATPAVADALDASALMEAVRQARPTHVIHELTALPKGGGVRRAADLAPTNRLRIDGTRHLIAAAIAAGAERIVVGSFAPMQGLRDATGDVRDGVAAVDSMESQTLEANRSGRIEGIVLRYGLFYGPDNPATQQMMAMARRRLLPMIRGDRSLLPCIHITDAVSATVAALHRGRPGETYDIVDDRPVSLSEFVRRLAAGAGAPRPFAVPAWLPKLVAPYMARVASVQLAMSNQKARTDLGWRPAFPTIVEGLADTGPRAA
jgi:nucleoside-diphosphate-sugar epimerase